MQASRNRIAVALWRRRLDGRTTSLTSLAGAHRMCALVPAAMPRVGPPGPPRPGRLFGEMRSGHTPCFEEKRPFLTATLALQKKAILLWGRRQQCGTDLSR